ncbi:MAG: cation diffusion facilitator CzcD-associated flavoprotein CzcO [Paracoccaceae bacterium]|jgi:cation diffusion facilitator CzcD-associated flavoprotein CzcO
MDHPTPSQPLDDHYDVLIIGAGISGIDAAYHLQKSRPGSRFAMIERMPSFGGTWRTHKFPGIRSDSDLFTFGFKWKPWTGIPIATADQILTYLNDALDENDLRRHIRYDTDVLSAAWSGDTQHWTVTLRHGDDNAPVTVNCNFLWMCSGYYNHTDAYTPDWPGVQQFGGTIVHPQTWPADLDHAGKKVVVIGSGATAATIIPAMTKTADHVTMLQRSPTYFFPKPMIDDFGETLRALGLSDEMYHDIMRRKFLYESKNTVRRSIEEPDVLAAELIGAAREYLGEDYDIATHFTPSYHPWRQRIAMIPDGDLFMAIRMCKASVVTGTIKTFTKTGITLESGKEIAADIIVTATGFNMNVLGDIAFEIDGAPLDLSQSLTHRGIMFTGLPNLAVVFGYLRSSWTLRADLVSDYICRMFAHMDKQGAKSVVPMVPEQDQDMVIRPWIDPENFNAGYVMRSQNILPRQGDRQPWVMTQDYHSDCETLPAADLNDGTLVFR